MRLFLAVLPVMKSYVMIFQRSGTWVHQLHFEQMKAIKRYFSYFIKPQHLSDDPAVVRKLNLQDRSIWLSDKQMFYGSAKNLISTGLDEDCSIVGEIVLSLRIAYIKTGEYMLKKLPIENPTLLALSSLDPEVRGWDSSMDLTISLGQMLKSFLGEEAADTESFELQLEAESRAYHNAPKVEIPVLEKEDNCLVFWNAELISSHFPLLTKIANVAFSIFHGPAIEGSFSNMANIVTRSRASLNTETYGAYQTMNTFLDSQNSTGIKYCSRNGDKHFGPIDKNIAAGIISASKRLSQKKGTRAVEQVERRRLFNISKPPTASSVNREEKKRQYQLTKKHAEAVGSSTEAPSKKKKT